MQTIVVGEKGVFSYQINLDGFPGYGWAFSYFAEIEDLSPTEPHKFKLIRPNLPNYDNLIVNVQENAQSSYRLYEVGFSHLSLPFVVSFEFVKTEDFPRQIALHSKHSVDKGPTLYFTTI